MEYIRYTERRQLTRSFEPTDEEHALYEAVSGLLQRQDSNASGADFETTHPGHLPGVPHTRREIA